MIHSASDRASEWARYRQAREESLRRDGYVIESLDAPEEPIWATMDDEASYRRGFSHGVAYAVEMIDRLYRQGSYSRATEIANIIDNWNVEILYPWRSGVFQDILTNGSAHFGHPPLVQENWFKIRKRILERDGWQCVECGSRTQLQADHIVSVVRGGLPSDENLQTLCKRCNLIKGTD